MTTVHITDWSSQGRSDFAATLRDALKRLLECKHLYQSLTIDLPEPERWAKNIGPDQKRIYEQETKRNAEDAWALAEPQLPGIQSMQKLEPHRMYLTWPTVKMFCDRCESPEAHNPSYALDITTELASKRGGYSHSASSQHFVAIYTCQNCKVMPQHFMIKRQGLKLSIVGRSPIEHLVIPDVIPKTHRKYYSDAILAFQSGQTLPALFMLRTFIEQFASSQMLDKSLRADAALDAYMSALPEPVRAHFASPREIYSKLSEAIHAAREDATLFASSCEQIIQHFEARRLYNVITA